MADWVYQIELPAWAERVRLRRNAIRVFPDFVGLYLRVHIALGWLLSTLAVLGFSGVVLKD